MSTGKFVKCNNNALNLLKYTLEELLAKGPVDLSPILQPDGSESNGKAIEYIIEAMKGEKPVFEWTLIDAEDREFICEIRLSKLSGTNDNTTMASFVDITDRKNDEKIREKITMELVHRNKDLEQFMYIVSHNLRAPVANIMGIADLLQSNCPINDESAELLSDLTTSVNRLDDVIIDLSYILQVKREVSEKKEIVSFSNTVENIKSSIADLIKNEKVDVLYDFSAIDEMFTLKSYLYSAFFNLISNSIKYRRPDIKPIIEITSAVSGNKIILTFKDNGLGIDLEKKRDLVFGLYKRFHTHAEGKGMGLYMTKTQIEIMGGSISIASEVNKGTEFRIEFDITD